MLTGARNRRSYEAAAYTEVPALRAGQLRLPHPTALDVRTMHVCICALMHTWTLYWKSETCM